MALPGPARGTVPGPLRGQCPLQEQTFLPAIRQQRGPTVCEEPQGGGHTEGLSPSGAAGGPPRRESQPRLQGDVPPAGQLHGQGRCHRRFWDLGGWDHPPLELRAVQCGNSLEPSLPVHRQTHSHRHTRTWTDIHTHVHMHRRHTDTLTQHNTHTNIHTLTRHDTHTRTYTDIPSHTDTYPRTALHVSLHTQVSMRTPVNTQVHTCTV